MNKSERTELRRIIRARFKVLRADIDQRRAELETELAANVQASFAAHLKQWEDTQYLVQEVVREANRKANDLYRAAAGDKWPTKSQPQVIGAATVADPRREERYDMLRKGRQEIDLKCRQALAATERREAEILEQLAVGALESADAKQFLSAIPTVGELVPAGRLMQQLEAE